MLPLTTILAFQTAFMRMPDIHGDLVVYTCEGDLWLGSINAKSAVRLTRDAGVEKYAKFSPDGQNIAYCAEYDGIEEVYVIPVSGGTPRRLTYRYDYAWPLGWNQDGSSVLFRTRNISRSFGLYTVKLGGGPETKLPVEFASHADMASDGQTFAWTRFNRAYDAWFSYKGGMQNNIWLGNTSTKQFKQITNIPGTNEFPTYAGDQIYFANENNSKFQLMRVNPKTGKTQNLGAPSDFEIREVSGGPGGVVYEKGLGLETFDPETNTFSELNFKMASDVHHTKSFTVLAEQFVTGGTLTSSGKRVLLETRGQIISVPAGPGESRLWKALPGVRLQSPQMSPDGKKVAYISDETGEEQLFIANADGTMPKQVTKDLRRNIVGFSFSPDSNWIAFNDSEMRFRIVNLTTGEDRLVNQTVLSWPGTIADFSPDSKWLVYSVFSKDTYTTRLVLYDIEKNVKHSIGNALSNDSLPVFSKDGKMIAFIGQRNLIATPDPIMNQLNLGETSLVCLLNLRKDAKSPLALKDTNEETPPIEPSKEEQAKPEPFRIDLDGLYDRMIVLPVPAGTYSSTAFVPGRLFLNGSSGVTFFDFATRKAGVLTNGYLASLSADGTKGLVEDRVVDTAGEQVPETSGKLNLGALRLTIEPLKEWRQMYWDAWRLLRDYFYVANMNGADWDAIGKKYESLLEQVRSRDELDILIRWLQAELGCSHQYLTEGDERNLSPKVAGAFLGIEVKASKNRLLISKLYRGDGFLSSERSSLLEPGMNVKEGDYLLAIGGQELTDTSNYLSYLAGRVGQTISVTIGEKPTMSDSRTVLVKPVASELRMKRLNWVEQNRQFVEKASGGKIGYLYLGAMTQTDMSDFVKQYFPQRGLDGLIVDTRFNNGGFIQDSINKILTTKVTGFFNQRSSSVSWSRQQDYFAGHIAVLQNEFNVSCGEEFTHRFRDLKRGAIIGRRTYGGEVGSDPGWPLIDGGIINVPNYGMWTPKDGWVIEGQGVEPDIDVISDPNLYAIARDAQLERAIDWVTKELAKSPIKRLTQPADPIRVNKD